MGRNRRIITASAEETIDFGKQIGASLPPGTVVCLFGDLGSGKTTLIKGLAEGFSGVAGESVNSPTFTYLNIYGENKLVYHFDLYRLGCCDEFLAMGFEEYLFQDHLACIEWSERIEKILPREAISIHLKHYNFQRVIECDFKTLNL